mmetsp:Transcript_32444/g.54445  ORF Transcript_32444/g.54445 Transcript_32444/m.54445 type:complete len:246 (+) Transcript_32444:622-1359(+)
MTPAWVRLMMIEMSTAVTSPTKPSSSKFLARALIMPASLPQRPTALPPACWMSDTIDLLTRPTSTISTTSIVALSVMRSPEGLNFDGMSSLLSHLLISGPPPCTKTGRNPRHQSSTRSLTTSSLSLSSFIAAPPYFTTTVRPLNCWMFGKASESTRTRSKASSLRRASSVSSKLGFGMGELGALKTPSSVKLDWAVILVMSRLGNLLGARPPKRAETSRAPRMLTRKFVREFETVVRDALLRAAE